MKNLFVFVVIFIVYRGRFLFTLTESNELKTLLFYTSDEKKKSILACIE